MSYMRRLHNEQGSVLVFITLMIVLLLIMVGMGLDTGQFSYTRSQGQAAVDAAALAAVSGLPIGDSEVRERVKAFNSKNDYVQSAANPLGNANITYVQYNTATGVISPLPDIAGANGVRVALEDTNPHTGATTGTGISTPAFLTPLMRLLGQSAPSSVDVSVSAVAALSAIPGIPIAIYQSICNGSNMVKDVDLLQSSTKTDNSCYTTYTQDPSSAKAVKAMFDENQTCSGLAASSTHIGVGTQIYLNNGQIASTYDPASDLFMKEQKDRCWMVPVVKDGITCNRTDAIVDWASICPTDVQKSKSPKYIRVNLTCNQSLFRTDSNLCFSARLLRDTKSGM
jgi:Flp pilus assembly protein TadG